MDDPGKALEEFMARCPFLVMRRSRRIPTAIILSVTLPVLARDRENMFTCEVMVGVEADFVLRWLHYCHLHCFCLVK